MSMARRAGVLLVCFLLFIFASLIITALSAAPVEAKARPAPDASPAVIRVRLSAGARAEVGFTISGSYGIPSGRLPAGQYSVRNTGGRLSLVNAEGAVLASASGPLLIQERRNDGGTSLITMRVGGSRRSYMGSMKFWPNGSAVEVINHVPLEKYLYGVVAYEMSDGFPLEALKAQAVAARCYAMKRLEGTRGSRHDIGDTSSDQVYKGYNAAYTNVRRAVDATAGQILQYKGATIIAYYSASNGGQTERGENVWSSILPYAKMRADPYDLANPSSREQVVYFPAGSTADKPEDRSPARLPVSAGQSGTVARSVDAQLSETTRLSMSGTNDSVRNVPLALGQSENPQTDVREPMTGEGTDQASPTASTQLITVVPAAALPPSPTSAAAPSPTLAAAPPQGPEASPTPVPAAVLSPSPSATPAPLAAAGPGIPEIDAFDESGLLQILKPTFLRTGAGDHFSRVASLEPGDRVMIVAPGRAWHYVEYKGQFGYVPAGRTDAPEVPEPPATASVPTAVPSIPPAAAAATAPASPVPSESPAMPIVPGATANPTESAKPSEAARPTEIPQPAVPAKPAITAKPTVPAKPPQPGALPKPASQSVGPRVVAPPAAWSKPATNGIYSDELMDRRLADFLKTQAAMMLNARNARLPSGSRFLAKAGSVRIKAILDMKAIQTPGSLACRHDPGATDLPPHAAGDCPSAALTGVRLKILLKVEREDSRIAGGYAKADFTWDFQFKIADWLKSSARPQWQMFTPGNGLRIYAVEKVLDRKGNAAYALINRRYGHGVGMSQRGAQQRAKDPRPEISRYQNILAFYYPGTVLVSNGLAAPDLPA